MITAIRQVPSARNSSSIGSGRVPFTRTSGARVKRRCHFGQRRRAAGRPGHPNAAGTRSAEPPAPALPAAARPPAAATTRPSFRARIWSMAFSTAVTSSRVAGTSPLRTRSNAVSTVFVQNPPDIEAEHGPRPFERMQGPEHRGDQLLVSPGYAIDLAAPARSVPSSWASTRKISIPSSALIWTGSF